jgi:hypothetical protein
MRTVPVNQSAGPFAEGCVPALLISILSTPCVEILPAARQVTIGGENSSRLANLLNPQSGANPPIQRILPSSRPV